MTEEAQDLLQFLLGSTAPLEHGGYVPEGLGDLVVGHADDAVVRVPVETEGAKIWRPRREFRVVDGFGAESGDHSQPASGVRGIGTPRRVVLDGDMIVDPVKKPKGRRVARSGRIESGGRLTAHEPRVAVAECQV